MIEGLGPQCRTNMEEIFGPVVTLQPFGTEEEAIALANEGNYGLSATIWSQETPDLISTVVLRGWMPVR